LGLPIVVRSRWFLLTIYLIKEVDLKPIVEVLVRRVMTMSGSGQVD